MPGARKEDKRTKSAKREEVRVEVIPAWMRMNCRYCKTRDSYIQN